MAEASSPDQAQWRRLFAAHVVSSVGDELTRIALPVQVYALGGGVGDLTLITLAQAFPSLVFAPLAGALSDRGHRRVYLVISDLARCACATGMIFAATIPTLGVLAAVAAAFSAVFRPVEASLEADLVVTAAIARVNAIRVASQRALAVIAPGAVGAFVAVASTRAAFGVDAVTFVLSAALVVAVRSPAPAVTGSEDRPAPAAGGAISYIFRDPVIRVLFLSLAVVVLLLGMQGPLLYDFVVVRLHGGAPEFGVLMAALGAGGVVMSIALTRWRRLSSDDRLLVIPAVLGIDALALLGFAASHQLAVCTAMMVAMGMISAVFQVVMRATLQIRAPRELRGRVLGWYEAMQRPLEIGSLALAVALVQRWSSATILSGAALVELGVGAIGLAVMVLALRRQGARPGAS